MTAVKLAASLCCPIRRGFDFFFLISLIRTVVSSDKGPCARNASRALRRACCLYNSLLARGGSESLYGSAWFGSVWGGILGGILGGIARAGFSHRESALPDPLNY